MDDLARERQRIFMWEVKRWIGKPYLWGAQGGLAKGLDCSGLVVEGLRASGDLVKWDDVNAHTLWEKYRKYEITAPREGALCFWLDSKGHAYHVAIAVGRYHCITADGGGSDTTTVEAAEQKNAYIRLLPIMHRKTQPKFVHIWKG